MIFQSWRGVALLRVQRRRTAAQFRDHPGWYRAQVVLASSIDPGYRLTTAGGPCDAACCAQVVAGDVTAGFAFAGRRLPARATTFTPRGIWVSREFVISSATCTAPGSRSAPAPALRALGQESMRCSAAVKIARTALLPPAPGHTNASYPQGPAADAERTRVTRWFS